MEMKELKQVRKWGNSGGVLLPREWIGKQIQVILIDRTNEIKKEVLDILSPFLEDIIGVYLVGSYARNEQNKESDIDIIAISKNTKKSISSGKYNIEIYTLEGVLKTLKSNPIMIYPRLKEAKTIFNASLLQEMSQKKLTKDSFNEFLESCKRIIKINSEFINLEKDKETMDTQGVVYSLMLRLRGIYLIKTILEKKDYSLPEFKSWLSNNSKLDKKDIEILYNIYKDERDNKKMNTKIQVQTVRELLELLKKQVEKYGKKRKTT